MTPRLTTPPFSLSRPAPAPAEQAPTGAPQQSPRQSRSWLGGVCAIASLAAHGILLALVIPSPNQARPPVADLAEPAPPLDDVSVTVLPKPALPAAAPPPAVVSAAPRPTAPAAPVAPALPTAAPAAPPAAAAPETAPDTAPETAPETAPPAAFTPAADPEPPPPPSPYANFPHLDATRAACEGLADCWRSPVSSSWRSAAGDLQARLEAQGYTVNNITGEVLSIDSGVRVYAVSKPGETDYYLNLISVREGVLYTMTTAPMTTDQVIALQRS